MKFQRAASTGGPSSSIGIMRFFVTDTGGPKMSPEFVVVVSAVIVLVILLVQFLG